MNEDAQSLVSDAVVAELRVVLNALDLDADVTIRQPDAPVVVSSSSPTPTAEDILLKRDSGPTVVIDLPLGDGTLLTELLRKNLHD